MSVAIILLIAWLPGLVAFHAGGLIYILFVIAIIFLIVCLLQRGRVRRYNR